MFPNTGMTSRKGCLVLVAVLATLFANTQAEDLQSFSYEEADGAIATAEQHIVQEQSHIIETLNLKLTKLKNDVELEHKHNEDLQKEKTDLSSEVEKYKTAMEQSQLKTLQNQDVLQKYIEQLKQEEQQEKAKVEKEQKEINALKEQLKKKEQAEHTLSMDLEQTQEKFNTLLKQKEQAIKQAKVDKVKQRAKYAPLHPQFHNAHNGDVVKEDTPNTQASNQGYNGNVPLSWRQQAAAQQSESMF